MVNETAKKVWLAYFGNIATANDAFGAHIIYSKYGQEVDGGWELDHIWPENHESESGANTYANIQPLFWAYNREKSNDVSGSIAGKKYFVKKISSSNNKITGRMAIEKNGQYFWAYKEPKY